ncbi:M48 family metallopeptidase [Cyclobacteriaceae bacterium]|nr:M48 family metallopeptidase [Cyclobacteriaceae bacterium]
MTPEQLLLLILAFIVVDFVFEKVLDLLNDKSQSPIIPEEAKGIYEEEEYRKSYQYNKEKGKFASLSGLFSLSLTVAAFAFGWLGWLDTELRAIIENPLFVSLAFFGIVLVVSDIFSTPFALYDTFKIEAKYGFNKMTLGTFWGDKFKGYLIGALIGGGLLAALISLIDVIGDNWWIYFWAVISIFILLINMFYTSWIVPLFNKLTPLEDGELRTAIEEYCKTVNFPLTNLFVIDGSKRSTKANAYFSGMGKKKKVVLFDTLIANHTTEELVAVLAHEIGHYKRNHIKQTFVLSIVQMGVMLFLLSFFVNNPLLSKALGAQEQGIHLSLIVFTILYTL